MLNELTRDMKVMTTVAGRDLRRRWLSNRLPSKPTTLNLLVNDICNSRCVMCNIWQQKRDIELTPEQLATRSTEQREILDSAVRYLKPGGTITYITCSVLPPENQHQVRAFLERHPDFAATPAHSVWMRHFSGSPLRARFSPEGGIALSPATTGTDGFYAVELVRSAPN